MTERTSPLSVLIVLLRFCRTVAVRRCALALCVVLLAPAPVRAECPDLQPYYPRDDSAWPAALQRLRPLLAECLQSAEYFALLGAAQMHSGQLTESMESLERALLIDPSHGAASIDYAQALYLSGQLFPALEVNDSVLQRDDVPPELRSALQQRDAEWRAQTRAHGFAAELAGGYDNNLNGGPSNGEFTLTLSGEPVPLALNREFLPVSGAYLNLRLSGFYRKLAPEKTHDVVYALRHRRSHHRPSDLLQFDWRYQQTLLLRRYRWDLVAGTSHLYFGGSPLFTVAEARARLNRNGDGCRPQYELALQHQSYHGQSFMRGLEASATAGIFCDFDLHSAVLGLDAGPLANQALHDARPGADRHGWRLRLYGQMALGAGQLSLQFSYAQLNDGEGYSDLLANGAKRQIDTRATRVQYSRPLQERLNLFVNLNHQSQGSNLVPFQNEASSAELGLGLAF